MDALFNQHIFFPALNNDLIYERPPIIIVKTFIPDIREFQKFGPKNGHSGHSNQTTKIWNKNQTKMDQVRIFKDKNVNS